MYINKRKQNLTKKHETEKKVYINKIRKINNTRIVYTTHNYIRAFLALDAKFRINVEHNCQFYSKVAFIEPLEKSLTRVVFQN